MAALAVYALGSVVALLRTDAHWPGRLWSAVLWPLGPLAFAVTVALLLGAALIAFPLFGVVVAGAAVAWWVAS